MKRILVQCAFLCVLGSAVGLGANALSPRTAPLGTPVKPKAEAQPGTCGLGSDVGAMAAVPRISVAEAQPLCVACSAAFVDARTEEEFVSGHVTGAIHLPPGDVPPSALDHLRRYSTVVVYDGEPSCAMADAVALGLREIGVKDVRVLAGAWPEWSAQGAPGASGPCPICAEPGAKP